MKFIILHLFLVLISLSSNAQKSLRIASCVVEKITKELHAEKIIEANNISVTGANGGLRQRCQYTAKDGKTTLKTVVFDLQGGIMVALYYGDKQLLLTGDSTPQTVHSSSGEYFKWLSYAVVTNPLNEELIIHCKMTSLDLNTIINTHQCPMDSDFPSKP